MCRRFFSVNTGNVIKIFYVGGLKVMQAVPEKDIIIIFGLIIISPLFINYSDFGVIIILNLSFLIIKDMGTIVLGKVESGVVTKGQSLYLMPNKVK